LISDFFLLFILKKDFNGTFRFGQKFVSRKHGFSDSVFQTFET